MLPTYCPNCRAIRQPNGLFCHACGYSYEGRVAPGAAAPATSSARNEVHLSVGSGFRFGLGLMAAAFLAGIIWLVLFAGLLGAMFSGLGR
jgi:hypothetical protein